MTALLLVVLLGFAALAVDLSNKYRVRGESQSTVDAAALAGARELRGNADGLLEAEQAARTVGEKHYAYKSNVTIGGGDIQIGTWNSGTRTFTTPVAPDVANAVRVRHSEPAVAHPFASPLIDTASSPVGAVAVALGGGPSTVGCGFPLTLASCTVQGGQDGNNCGGCLKMAAAPSDNVGWANFDGNTSVPAITSALKAACFAADGQTPALDSDGRCTGMCADPPVAGEDEMRVGNGNNFTTNQNQFCELVKKLLRASPTGTVRTQVPVFESGSAGSCNPQFSGSKLAVGFAELELLGAKCGNADRDPVVPRSTPAGCDAPADKYLIARVACGTRSNSPAGGGFFGLWARPVLVD